MPFDKHQPDFDRNLYLRPPFAAMPAVDDLYELTPTGTPLGTLPRDVPSGAMGRATFVSEAADLGNACIIRLLDEAFGNITKHVVNQDDSFKDLVRHMADSAGVSKALEDVVKRCTRRSQIALVRYALGTGRAVNLLSGDLVRVRKIYRVAANLRQWVANGKDESEKQLRRDLLTKQLLKE